MGAIVKRTKTWKEKLAPGKSYAIDEALKLVKEFATAKFNESVDVSVNLGVDATKSDQQVRGSTVMPHGTGKTVRVAVFTQGKNADAAKAAGADIVGFEDLAEKVKAGQIDFDVVIASPDAMRIVGQLGQILGPRGLATACGSSPHPHGDRLSRRPRRPTRSGSAAACRPIERLYCRQGCASCECYRVYPHCHPAA